jgi:flavin reductase (DIM6/NTAB) family NADH-FMN oxidoreductase RutF
VDEETNLLDPEDLRRAMRFWTTGVTIVTSQYNHTQHGMTVNSFTSVSLDPPVVTVSLAKSTRTYTLVRHSGIYAVTILAENHADLADRFAGRGVYSGEREVDRFTGIETFSLVTGAPLLAGGIAFLDCKVIHQVEIGTTMVFYGEVIASRYLTKGWPLAYFNRIYRGLQR